MICAELLAEESITDFMPDRIRAIGKKGMMLLSKEICS
jgi:hypothetical protein